jgi:hypothetical protein
MLENKQRIEEAKGRIVAGEIKTTDAMAKRFLLHKNYFTSIEIN